MYKTFWKNHRVWSECIRLRKTLYNFYQQKILFAGFKPWRLCEVYHYQLFSILINFSGKLCFRHKQKLFIIFLKIIRGGVKLFWGHALIGNKFTKLHFIANVSCNFSKFLHQRFGSAMRGYDREIILTSSVAVVNYYSTNYFLESLEKLWICSRMTI